jgi:hypothetical protein
MKKNLKRYIKKLEERIKKKEITPTHAKKILRGRMLSIIKKKKKAIEAETLIKNLYTKIKRR